MCLLSDFFPDTGVIACNEYFFQLLSKQGYGTQLPSNLARKFLRILVDILELGVDDAVVSGAAVLSLVGHYLPELHEVLTSEEYPLAPPRDSKIDYDRFTSNFEHVKASFHLLLGNTINDL